MKKTWLRFDDGSMELAQLQEWWQGLAGRSGDRAALRRARAPDEVVFVAYYHELVRQLRQGGVGLNRFQLERVACIAGLSARVKHVEECDPLPVEMARPRRGSLMPTVRGPRFRRLLTVADDELDRLFETLGRLIHLLGDRADLGSLARGVFWWNEATRRQWAYAYYGAIPERSQTQ